MAGLPAPVAARDDIEMELAQAVSHRLRVASMAAVASAQEADEAAAEAVLAAGADQLP